MLEWVELDEGDNELRIFEVSGLVELIAIDFGPFGIGFMWRDSLGHLLHVPDVGQA